LSVIVEPAWAVAETATSGNKREIVRRCLVDMFRLHEFGSAVMCALTRSSEPIADRLQAHADVKAAIDAATSRRFNIAAAKVQGTIEPFRH